jgi:hypothetical protein
MSRGPRGPGVPLICGRVLPSLQYSQVSLGGKPAGNQVRLPLIYQLLQTACIGQKRLPDKSSLSGLTDYLLIAICPFRVAAVTR